MPQETPNQGIPLPEKVQEAINLATAKVEVLRDEELRLGRLKGEMEKEVARLEITRDMLQAEIPKLEESLKVAQSNAELAEQERDRLKGEVSAAQDELRSFQKAAAEAKAVREQEETKLSEIVVAVRAIEKEVEEKRAELKEAEEAFEKRKAHVRDLLGSI